MIIKDISWLFLSIITSFLISYLSMPALIKIAGLKKLIDKPEEKIKSNVIEAPALGGIGIFAAFLIAFSIWGKVDELAFYPFLVASLFMLILTGINDDILEMTPTKKLIIQFLASAEIVVAGKVAITNLGGLFGIHQMPFWLGAIISICILVTFINSFNFIAGLDGLKGGLGIIISSIFGIWFYVAGFFSMAILSSVLSAALLGFLIYNIFPAKISIGDTGSSVIGFILAFIAIKFVQLNEASVGNFWHINASIVFAFAVMIIPTMDVIRVAVIRLITGKDLSKFSLIHSYQDLLEAGMAPALISFSFWMANFVIIATAYLFSGVIDPALLFITISFMGLLAVPLVKVIFRGIHLLLNFKSEKGIYFKGINSK